MDILVKLFCVLILGINFQIRLIFGKDNLVELFSTPTGGLCQCPQSILRKKQQCPKSLVGVKYLTPTENDGDFLENNDKSNREKVITPGDKLFTFETRLQPKIFWPKENGKLSPKYFYTLVLFDPDVPSRKNPTLRSRLQWLVVNIPYSNKTGLNVSRGKALAEYPSSPNSQPLLMTGYHRQIFLLYRQKGSNSEEKVRIRTKFDVNKYAKDRGLKLQAANYLLNISPNGLETMSISDFNFLN